MNVGCTMRWDQIVNEDVWHGSPHRFDSFSTDHIGTGEGHMRYGWGLYFTGTKEVAEYYRRSLARQFTYKGRAVDPESWLHSAIYHLVHYHGDKEEAKRGWKPTSKVAQLIAKIDYSQVRIEGYVYGVHLPDASEFLLWDALLDQQSPRVQSVIKSLIKIPAEVEVHAKYEPERTVWQVWDDHLARSDRRLNGEELYWTLAAQRHGEKAASLALLAAGVHGIKYLDGVSRDQGQGSYNYVIFDGALTTITQKPKRSTQPV